MDISLTSLELDTINRALISLKKLQKLERESSDMVIWQIDESDIDSIIDKLPNLPYYDYIVTGQLHIETLKEDCL